VIPNKLAVRWPDRAHPVTPPFDRPRLAFARDDATGSDKQPGMSERILLVEDDFLVAMQMESTLTEAGFEVVGVASSGEDAIELAISERPRLVVMDIRLAGDRDGIDTALQLFAEHGLRCIFATAHQDEHARRRAAPAAPLGWLQKPYSMPSLVEMVLRSLKELGGETR
jgi:DNA-binding NarL/FixJ family response regulator